MGPAVYWVLRTHRGTKWAWLPPSWPQNTVCEVGFKQDLLKVLPYSCEKYCN